MLQPPNTTSDTLIARCRNKEPNAYKEIYNLYAKAMLNISMRIVNDKDEAEDILQESFIKAFQDMGRFENQQAFGGWLKRVVINRSIDTVRKQKLHFIPIEDADRVEPENQEEESFPYEVGSVMQCLQELPQGYRIILTLFLFENYSHREISQALNISEGTSRSQYNRAKKKLTSLIKQKTTVHEHA